MMKTCPFGVQRSAQPSPSLRPGVNLEDVREGEEHMLGRLLDLFLFREVRGAVEQALGVKGSNGNGA